MPRLVLAGRGNTLSPVAAPRGESPMRSPGRHPASVRAGNPRRGTIVAIALTLVLMSGCTVSVDWMSRLFDETHGGHTPDNVLSASSVGTLKQKWRVPAPSCNG